VIEELNQQLVNPFRLLMLHPVGRIRKERKLCRVIVPQTLLCHIGKEKPVRVRCSSAILIPSVRPTY
jgi:hypothetical protein